jgi:hypothetical protein
MRNYSTIHEVTKNGIYAAVLGRRHHEAKFCIHILPSIRARDLCLGVETEKIR